MGVVEVYELDYSSYDSVKAFAARLAELERVDIAVLTTEQFGLSEDNQNTITVNVISTALLTPLIPPTILSLASKYNIEPVISVMSSVTHGWTSFPERKTPNSLATLNDKETANMEDRHASPRSFRLSHAESLPPSLV